MWLRTFCVMEIFFQKISTVWVVIPISLYLTQYLPYNLYRKVQYGMTCEWRVNDLSMTCEWLTCDPMILREIIDRNENYFSLQQHVTPRGMSFLHHNDHTLVYNVRVDCQVGQWHALREGNEVLDIHFGWDLNILSRAHQVHVQTQSIDECVWQEMKVY